MLLIQLRDAVEIVEAHPVSYIPITSLFTGLILKGRASYLLRFSGKRCPLAVGFAIARSSCATPPHKKESQSHYKRRKQINSDFVLNTWFSKQRNNNPHSKNNTVKNILKLELLEELEREKNEYSVQ